MAREELTEREESVHDKDRHHVTFNYIKSMYYRVVHADGVIGGLTPKGYIHCSFFSERLVIPRIMRHEIKEDGSLSDGEVVEAREGVSREMEVDIVFDERAAIEFHEWLGRQIARLQQLKREVSEK